MVANIVASSQPMVVANIRDILVSIKDLSAYKSMIDKGRCSKQHSPLRHQSDNTALQEATEMESQAEEDSESSFDLSKVLTADPCIYNARLVCLL